MTPKDIHKRLIDLELTAAELARSIGVSKQAVSQTIKGDLRTPWIRRSLAEMLGMTYRGLWGEDDPGTLQGSRAPTRQRRGSLHSSSVAPIAGEIDAPCADGSSTPGGDDE